MTECFCARCRPTTAEVVCSRCGDEIRRGWRHGQEGFWHRLDVDHMPVLGHTMTTSDHAVIEAALDEPRIDANGQPYTTRDFDIARIKDRDKREAAERDAAEAHDEEWAEVEIPEPEVLSTPIEKTDPRLPGGAKTIWNLAEKQGWRVYRATYSRGPRVHAAHGRLLSISDYLVLGMALDDADLAAVGSWCDGKFEYAYTAKINRKTRTITPTKVKSDALKAFIRGE